MMIKIDNREHNLIQIIKKKIEEKSISIVELKIENLPIGDIIICNDKGDEIIIIERKSLNDLIASIKDGRYEEQSYRLQGTNIHSHNIIYLIEGDISKTMHDKKTIYSAMFSLNYYKGFSVAKSNNIEESATIILNMVTKMNKSSNKKGYYLDKPNKNKSNNEEKEKDTNEEKEKDVNEEKKEKETNEDVKSYCHVIKKIKKENITPDNIGEIMLSQIPSVSSATAIEIMKKFKTISNLIISINENSNILNDIKIINAKNQSRKISKTAIENIYKYIKSEKTESEKTV